VSRAGREIELTVKEFQLLEFLMRRAGQVVTRMMLLEAIWNLHFDPQTNLIDVHMSRLRAAVDRGFDRQLLHTVRGAGYMIRNREGAPN
jgi:two-component system OmpR family response regulator